MTEASTAPPDATSDSAEGEVLESSTHAVPDQPQSGTSAVSPPSVRKSSLRPAPPDYRPSVRDPSQLRPIAVVRAGDADPAPLRSDALESSPSQRPQALSAGRAKAEPFALAEDLYSDETGDRTTPVMIPPPAAVAVPPTRAATRDHHDGESGDSRSRNLSATSKARKYSPMAMALACVALIGVVVAVTPRHIHIETAAGARAPVQPKSTATGAPEPANAPEVVNQPDDNVVTAHPQTQLSPPTPSAVEPVASAQAGMTHVTLDLTPIDAKVYYLGKEVRGPPFEFDVPKGHRIAVEALRSGFATAKIVIEDKKPLVHFGMLREHRRNGALLRR